MRVLYLDEAGIGNLAKDPILVVAGVLINADTQWGALAKVLQDTLRAAVPKGVAVPNHLHAKDIWHGSGEFSREQWPQDVRNALLDAVARIPAQFDVPVVWSAIDRKAFAREQPGHSQRELVQDSYTVATITCIMQAEMYLRALPNQGEVASVVLEQNQELQKRIPEMIRFMNNADGEGLLDNWDVCMPLQKIIDTPACQPKTAASILQMADFCAFAIKRFLQRSAGATRLTGPIAPQLLRFREADLSVKRALWNPKFMPQAWGNKIAFANGRFVRTD